MGPCSDVLAAADTGIAAIRKRSTGIRISVSPGLYCLSVSGRLLDGEVATVGLLPGHSMPHRIGGPAGATHTDLVEARRAFPIRIARVGNSSETIFHYTTTVFCLFFAGLSPSTRTIRLKESPRP